MLSFILTLKSRIRCHKKKKNITMLRGFSMSDTICHHILPSDYSFICVNNNNYSAVVLYYNFRLER